MENILSLQKLNNEAETIIELLAKPGLRIEKILSAGQVSAPGFWYDQPEAEWVCLLAGSAVIEYEDGHRFELIAGGHLDIPAGCRHRVAQCSNPALWLAVFYDE